MLLFFGGKCAFFATLNELPPFFPKVNKSRKSYFFEAKNSKIDAKILYLDSPKRKSKCQFNHPMTLAIFHIL